MADLRWSSPGVIMGPGNMMTRVECGRLARGLTRKELCERTGIKPKRVRELERVYGPMPTDTEREALCRVLDFGPRWFREQTIVKVRPLCPRWRQ